MLWGAIKELANIGMDPHFPEMTSTEPEKQEASLLPGNLFCVLGTLAQGPQKQRWNFKTQNAQAGAWVRKREECRCGLLRSHRWLLLATMGLIPVTPPTPDLTSIT